MVSLVCQNWGVIDDTPIRFVYLRLNTLFFIKNTPTLLSQLILHKKIMTILNLNFYKKKSNIKKEH